MKILIVEDNVTDRELLLESLQEHFMTEAKFREARDLSTAFQYLNRGYFDCVLLDLHLPDSTGWETFQSIHNRYPEIPIVVVTHDKSHKLAIEMIRAGACDVIIKDFTNTTMLFRRVTFAVERAKGLEGPFTRSEVTQPGVKI